MTAIPKPRRVKDQHFLDWVKTLPCLLRGRFGHVCNGPIDPNHITPKMGGKVGSKTDDRRALPFCRNLHDLYHFLGSQEAFESRFPVLLDYEISRLNKLYTFIPTHKVKLRKAKVMHVQVQCICSQKTHKFPPSKVNHGFFCPFLKQHIEIA